MRSQTNPKRFLRAVTHGIKKNDRLIGTTATFLGFGASIYFTAKVSPKINDILKETEADRKDPDKKKAKKARKKAIKRIIKEGWPAAVAIAATSGCIIGNHHLNTNKITALTAGLELANRKVFQLEDKNKKLEEQSKMIEAVAKDVVGEEKAEALKEEFEAVKTADISGKPICPGNTIVKPGEVLCREHWTGCWFSSDEKKRDNIELAIENELIKWDRCSLDDILRMMGVDGPDIPDIATELGYTPKYLTSAGYGSRPGFITEAMKTDEGVLYLDVRLNATPITLDPFVER